MDKASARVRGKVVFGMQTKRNGDRVYITKEEYNPDMYSLDNKALEPEWLEYFKKAKGDSKKKAQEVRRALMGENNADIERLSLLVKSQEQELKILELKKAEVEATAKLAEAKALEAEATRALAESQSKAPVKGKKSAKKAEDKLPDENPLKK